MEENNRSVIARRRSLTRTRRATVDGIDTHSGFIETPGMHWTFHQSIQTACDRFMSEEFGMVWRPSLQDYFPAPISALANPAL